MHVGLYRKQKNLSRDKHGEAGDGVGIKFLAKIYKKAT